MGVPTFFKWLSVRYPRVLRDAIEPDSQLTDGGFFVPPDPSVALEPNPNGEFDHVYLDMNGIIHPCCHPEGCEPPSTEADMFEAIFDYIDRLVLLLRPRRLLYMAIDGVAPRAKMNQQRMRRFKSAAEAAENEDLWEELRVEAEAAGRAVPMKKPHWDHNVITPGTPFFARLSQALRWYILQRQLSHPAWRKLRVFLSDANVPGEGEHKIMAFIRNQRHVPGYNPNTRHCLCGADADLIMLGLATHEVQFSIVREQVPDPKEGGKPCSLCGQKGHAVSDCPQASSANEAPKWTLDMQRKGWQPMTFLHLPILREYLAEEFCFREHLARYGVLVPVPSWKVETDPRTGNPLTAAPVPPRPEELAASQANRDRLVAEGKVFVPDLERCIDDFIIMCFFVGNDFLPHLPSLSIHKGSIDQMVVLYRHLRPLLPSYLCDAGHLNLTATRIFARHLGEVEGDVFRAEARRMLNLKRKDEAELQQQQQREDRTSSGPQATGETDANYAALAELQMTLFASQSQQPQAPAASGDNSAVAFEESLTSSEGEDDVNALPLLSHTQQLDLFKAKMREKKKRMNECLDVKDEIGLGDGDPREWRRRYYSVKFDGSIADSPPTALERLAGEVARRYAEGMQWVALYYFQGVPSWGWYYPFHYAPLASDVAKYGLSQPFTFERGDPFKPFQQLMAVLPARSSHCLPPALRKLMTDPASPIRDFYPNKFVEDPDGKRFRWQWVVKLPFIDHKRLTAAVDAVTDNTDDLTEDDHDRNCTGNDQVFLPAALECSRLYQRVAPSRPAPVRGTKTEAESLPLRAAQEGIGGTLAIMKQCRKPGNFPPMGSAFDSGIGDAQRFPPIHATGSTVAGYTIQVLGRSGKPKKHQCALLKGAKPQTGHLQPGDWTSDTRRFNAGPAKRMILGALGRQGILRRDDVDRLCDEMRGSNRQHQPQQPLSVNRYETEMFGHEQQQQQQRRQRGQFNGNFLQHKRPRRD